MEQQKEVKIVFNDYSADSFALADALVSKVNLYKKTNVMEIYLDAKEHIAITEIQKFEKYAIKRFGLRDCKLKITTPHTDLSTTNNFVQSEWNDSIKFLSAKVPAVKAFMKDSKTNFNDDNIEVELNVKGKDILEKQRVDSYISDFLSDTYGKCYKVFFKDNENGDAQSKLKEENINIIKEFTKQAEDKARTVAANSGDVSKEVKEKKTRTASDNSNANKSDSNNSNGGNPPPIDDGDMPKKEEKPEDPTLIYGRNSKVDETCMQIADIGMDTSNLQIKGDIVNSPDPTELKKTGKFLFSFDVYDGTSTITCKIFALPEQKAIGKRLKPGTGVIVKGRAGYDNFAKEITVIANTVVECDPMPSTSRMDNSKEKRVELHMHTQMSQMDGVSSASDLIKRAMKWGMKSIAITDHGVVQSFPDAYMQCSRNCRQ